MGSFSFSWHSVKRQLRIYWFSMGQGTCPHVPFDGFELSTSVVEELTPKCLGEEDRNKEENKMQSRLNRKKDLMDRSYSKIQFIVGWVVSIVISLSIGLWFYTFLETQINNSEMQKSIYNTIMSASTLLAALFISIIALSLSISSAYSRNAAYIVKTSLKFAGAILALMILGAIAIAPILLTQNIMVVELLSTMCTANIMITFSLIFSIIINLEFLHKKLIENY